MRAAKFLKKKQKCVAETWFCYNCLHNLFEINKTSWNATLKTVFNIYFYYNNELKLIILLIISKYLVSRKINVKPHYDICEAKIIMVILVLYFYTV